MIKKILIANRGEIASRIIRTCKRLNIKTVAVYSEADQHAPYVKEADESYLIGPPPVNQSYLNIEKLIEIAKQANVDAIHPGYGFLSEHASFPNICKKAGIIFIGPSPQTIEQMGNKVMARQVMEKNNIPVIPGTDREIKTKEEAVSLAKAMGYPLMLKASAGGGGIGMEVVHSEEDLLHAFENHSKRAENFFGDGTMFMEKLIENARHIEIQLLADHHGNIVHLFERECSIQRRNQKVVEEAPSSFITAQTRTAMGKAAVAAAKAIKYTNAGTVEFLIDQEENFYFLEMNTRIQVEHPITEEITGIDIVEAQINIARGEQLSYTQEDITMSGHSIEVRIYAEDPVTFFPSPGQIKTLDLPKGPHIRHELTVENQMNVSPFYDPMIGKLIVTGKSRDEAVTLLTKALNEYTIEGIKTNLPALRKIVSHEQFKQGHTTTSFIDDYYLPMV